MRRYARVSTSMGGLAVRFAGERLFGIEADHGARAVELTRALGGLKGPLMKVAQIMSTIPDALPGEYAAELAQLQANAPSMGWPFVRRRMSTELGADWQDKFSEFGHEAAAAASLGQVHKARAKGAKRPLACKLQYPDMQSTVEADLSQLRAVFAVYRRYDSSIDPSHALEEIGMRLREELDYRLEARHMALFDEMLDAEAHVHVPGVVPELSTGRLLTMDWLDGAPLLDYCDHGQDVRNTLARNMFRAWWVPFYHYGIIHGDPHLGNYTVRPDLSINLLDFGCIRVFPPKFVNGVMDLYRALDTDDWELAVHAYETWGFTGLSREIIETLHLWAEFLYAPLLDDRPRRIHESAGNDASASMYGAEVAAKIHRRLRELGTVTPPREFVFMDRAAIGLGAVFLHLRAEINWYEMFHDVVRDFDSRALAKRQKAVLKKTGVPAP